jgi:hypothetical protein
MILIKSKKNESDARNNIQPQPLHIDLQLLNMNQILRNAFGLLDITH